jgi:acyl-CoA thioesterase FadM
LELATWTSDVTEDSFVRHSTITRVRDGTRLARVLSMYAWIDLATRKPISIPSAFLADLASNTAA